MFIQNQQYDVLLVDPPWKYSKRSNKDTKFGLGSSQEDQLSYKEMAALPIGNLGKPDSVLFIWTTMPKLNDAMRLIEAWGYEYKTVGFTWIKVNKLDKKPVFGIGFYTKSNAELCLLATKGEKAIKPRNNDVSSVILHPPMEFSHKPPQVQERIDRMYPDLKKLELFAKVKTSLNDSWHQMKYENPSKEKMEDQAREQAGLPEKPIRPHSDGRQIGLPPSKEEMRNPTVDLDRKRPAPSLKANLSPKEVT